MNTSDFSNQQQPVPGSPVPGYPTPGYPAPGAPLERPGGVMAAAVLGYIFSAILFLAGLIVLAGTSAVDGAVSSLGGDAGAGQAYLLGLANLLAGGLFIAGGVTLTGGKVTGRTMESAAVAIVVLCGLRWASVDGISPTVALVFTAPALLIGAFTWQPSSVRWLNSRQ